MPAFTAQALIDRAADMADMSDGFVQPKTWLSWLRIECTALDIFMARNGYVQNIVTQTTVIDPLNPTISLNSDILGLVGVWEVVNGRYRRLTQRDPVNFRTQDPANGAVTGPATYYTVETRGVGTGGGDGYTIKLFPRVNIQATYAVAYLPPSVVSDLSLTSVLYYPMGYEEAVVMAMAKRALIKEDSDTTELTQQIQEWRTNVEEQAWDRQLADTPAVRNVDMAVRGWNNWIDFPSPVSWSWF